MELLRLLALAAPWLVCSQDLFVQEADEGPRDVTIDVDWPAFLARHDMLWDWEWGSGGAYTMQLRGGEDLHHCGPSGAQGRCCVAVAPGERRLGQFMGLDGSTPSDPPAGRVQLALCNASMPEQQWRPEPMQKGAVMRNVASDACLTAGEAVTVAACGGSDQVWADYTGFFVSGGGGLGSSGKPASCLQVDAGGPFCDGTICPVSFARPFTAGMAITTAVCHNGDRSQLFALHTIPAPGAASVQNLIPLTWAVSAYVGNGLIGVRLVSEEGGTGVLRLLLDNVHLGAGGKRQPTGYFRMITNAKGLPLRVQLRQRIHDAVLEGNITNVASGAVAVSFTCFVNADHAVPAVVVRLRWGPDASSPQLQWVPQGHSQFAWVNTTTATELVAYAAIGGDCKGVGCVGDAEAVVSRAKAAGHAALLLNHTAWWAAYWPHSFISVPVTRLEGYYYAEMYRFPSSDRVTLHGLMGAFGPTGNFNLWSDYVWDMNQQVMYWLAAASNRPEISAPMMDYIEKHPMKEGGLWMFHNYVKQARFEGRSDRLRDFAWGQIVDEVVKEAGKEAKAPGGLTLIGGVYHYGAHGCYSPEYRCDAPFEHRACSTKMDCNYGLAQLRWGLATALSLTDEFGLSGNLTARGIDVTWWRGLLAGKLAWYPSDPETGFRLDANCAFRCPHRHFSHLLQIFDLETVNYDPAGNASLNKLVHASIDNWYEVTCNRSNWFNEECRGFTQCALTSMSAISGRADAAAGNLSSLVDTVVTPNGMYGEMVYMSHPDEFSPVSESAYCGAGSLHTMLLHSSVTSGVLSIFPSLPATWRDAAFHELRASGGLLVSAVRRNGSTSFVRLLRPSGGEVLLSVGEPTWLGGVRAEPAAASVHSTSVPGVWEVTLPPATPVLLYPSKGGVPDFTIAPVAGNTSEYNWFGYRREMQPLH